MSSTLSGNNPLGVNLTPEGAAVGLYSAHATDVYFCLYDSMGEREVSRVRLTPDGSGAHRAFIPGVVAGSRYGFRVDGPYDPANGHRFDVSKLLTDPYAVEIDRPFTLHASQFERGVDSGAHVPKGIAAAASANEPGHARVAWNQTIIYELNLRGFTKLREDIPEAARGRFAGLAHPNSIAHLKSLGVTSVEIMPADASVDERHLPPLGLTNAWGYNPVVLGAPDPRLAPGGWLDVRAATDALHEAGLEVILDVVLNHNGESDEFGPTLSFRGLDNASYFRLIPDDLSRYVNDMGCGNCLALDRPVNIDMTVAALRRWMILGGIDGFRFDLASAIGRRAWGFDAQAPLFQAIAADPVLSKAKMIAEPWDIGPGGYQLGAFPEGWGEWNDRFRDTARRFWRGDGEIRGDLATRLAGSHDLFKQAASPAKSVTFIVAHDGFTLADLVSYSAKHNEANGEQNRDGTNENYSWNNGAEGPTGDPTIREARTRDMRNLLATLFVARGVPMLAMGAETGHGQHGNNNAYAQDNAISWIDWSNADASLIHFVGRLAAIRREHPALSDTTWLKGAPLDGVNLPDVEWRDAEGPMTTGEHWRAPFGDVLTAVLSATQGAAIDRVVVAIHRGGAPTSLRLPEMRDGMIWRVLIDTSDDNVVDKPTAVADRIPLPARAVLIVAECASTGSGAKSRAPDSRDIDALADAAGIAREWWDVGGKHTMVSAETKIALLEALRLPARTQSAARESLARLVEETSARRLPYSLNIPLDGSRKIALRTSIWEAARPIHFAIVTEDGKLVEGEAPEIEAERKTLADGREIVERRFELPPLPIGRHRLVIDGASCLLTISPPEAYGSRASWRRRFGASAQLYALKRAHDDQGVGDFTTLGLAGAAAGARGAAFMGVSPMHALFPHDRGRASPYHPSDRRFLEPFLIDVLADDDLPMDETCRAELAALAPRFKAAAAAATVDYELVGRLKERALRARFAAFHRARSDRPSDPIFAERDQFVVAGGATLRRFAIFSAISEQRGGEDWRRWPDEMRRADDGALTAITDANTLKLRFHLFCQWLADRQLAGAAKRAQDGGLEIGLYRDLAVGSAPDGAESWARADELAVGASVGAPPDPFSAQGQVWHLPPPDPIAGARTGWRGLANLYAANMRHAGLLRIDHAMGLSRLFVIPDGAKPAEGAYVSYPVDDILGQITLESQRHRCMVIGEDLGTVPEGFREKMNRAHISGMKVLWFERSGLNFLNPIDYPVHSIACASTHDLPTLAGWWRGADIAERLNLGLAGLEDAERAIADRLNEKHALVDALLQAGHLAESPRLDDPMTDALAAAIHAFVGGSGSVFASAQFDDLAGETVATNLPGTDRERPNWRHRLEFDVETLLTTPRATAIIDALARGRK